MAPTIVTSYDLAEERPGDDRPEEERERPGDEEPDDRPAHDAARRDAVAAGPCAGRPAASATPRPGAPGSRYDAGLGRPPDRGRGGDAGAVGARRGYGRYGQQPPAQADRDRDRAAHAQRTGASRRIATATPKTSSASTRPGIGTAAASDDAAPSAPRSGRYRRIAGPRSHERARPSFACGMPSMVAGMMSPPATVIRADGRPGGPPDDRNHGRVRPEAGPIRRAPSPAVRGLPGAVPVVAEPRRDRLRRRHPPLVVLVGARLSRPPPRPVLGDRRRRR